MAENQTQLNPQFILWIKEAGVFRPAEVKFPDSHEWYDIGYDLEKNCQIGTEDISPNTLNLVSSLYLGPIRISEEIEDGSIIQKDIFQRKGQFKHGSVKCIVNLAEKVAQSGGVPYFSVGYVHSPIETTWKFTEKEGDLTKKLTEDKKYSFLDKFTKSKGPFEFVLHPTAQLYVPRE